MAVLSTVVSAFGYTLIAYTASQILQFLYFNLRPSSLQKYGKKHRLYSADSPTWALVTGASDGLGVAFAHELASSGFNVIIHGRNRSKLEGIKAGIEEKHRVQVRLLVIDAEHEPTSFDEASYKAFDKAIEEAAADIKLTLLVNNIGVLGTWEPIAERPPDGIDRMINMNVGFPTQLTRKLLPILAASGPSFILNVSSESDTTAVGYAVLYAAAKAWGQAFHRCLRYELRFERQNIEVMTVIYGFIATASTGRTEADVTFGVAGPRTAARAALNKIGCGYSQVTPYIGHQLQGALIRLFPIAVQEKAVSTLMLEQKHKMEAIAKKA
ncbi:NAD(P)-binding protein [Thozetella sp. PMI_491]|nr:NAD(P)-binding protein [Thozetella sp. PMI_491]